MAVGYEYQQITPPKQPQIEVLCNENDVLSGEIKEDSFKTRYITNKYATCHIMNKEVVSICHADNSAVSIETKDKYRKNGFGKACLARIVKQMMDDESRVGYGTGYENIASRRTAESVGFDLSEYMYWIEIPADRIASIPEETRETLLGTENN